MQYRRPKLVMALGSSGGYRAFLSILGNVDPELMGKGMLYLADHVGPTDQEIKMYWEAGFDVIGDTVMNREMLESGKLRFQHDVYETYEDGRQVMVIRPNGKGPHFVRTGAISGLMGLSYSIKSALDSGYGEDMMAVFLSGAGDDGCKAVGQLELNGSRILIQEPTTAIIDELPWNLIYRTMYSERPVKVLEPEKIADEINGFLRG